MRTAKWIVEKIKASTGNDIDPAFFNRVAQFAHFGMTFFVTTVVIAICTYRNHPKIGMVIGFSFCFMYAAIHEFVWDPREENAATRGSDFEDFCFLIAGSAAAILLRVFLGA